MRGSGASSRPIVVAIVAPSMDHFLGGQEVQGDQLVRNWNGDAEVRAVLVVSNPPLRLLLRSLEAVPGVRTLLRVPQRAVALWRVMRQIDVVQVFSGAHSSFLLATAPALAAAFMRGKPTIAHYHSPRGDEHLATSTLARVILRRCDAVVVPSRYLQEVFARHAVPSHIIPNVVDTARFPFRLAPAAGLRVLCARNFEPRYAVDDVIRAFAQVKGVLPTAHLVLAGSGPDEAALRTLVRTLALPDVTFAGATSRDDMGRLMATAAVMVNASRIDNMPVSILEAFAAGVPVVSTSAGGIPVFARHNETALLAEPGDVDRLAAHVLAILRDPSLRQRLIAAARAEADRCTWSAVRPAWVALYRDVVAARDNSVR